MPLVNVPLTIDDGPLPASVADFLREADRRIDVFQQTARLPGFVPSDYPRVYRTLRSLAEAANFSPRPTGGEGLGVRGQAPGNLFCEWGSGFGVVACLAAMLGFESAGIEIDAELVTASQSLAHDFALRVNFVRGSYIPRGADVIAANARGTQAWLDTDATGAPFDADDFDVIFAYPWPDENGVTDAVFERYAAHSALLVTYHADGPVRVRRNSRKKRKR